MLRLFGIISFMILFLGQVEASDWELIKKRAEKMYGGIDMKVKINVENITDDGGELQSSVSIEVPMFSWKEREEKWKYKVAFLTEGAKILREIEEIEEILKVNKEKEKVLKQALTSEGIDGIEKYFNLKMEIVRNEAILRQKKRELEIYVAKSGLTR